MKFGEVPLGQAEGAVLGHTVRLAGGQVLKKGRRLDAGDLEALGRAGHAEVVCARLEPGELGEDEAAARLARAAAGPGVRAAEAATGRANLFAARAGLFVVDRAAVDAANALGEALTLATLAPYARVDEGDLVATVKVIPFAAPGALVEACAGALGGLGGAALAVQPFGRCEAGLVLTRLPGVPETLLDRAAAAQRRRVERLGGRLTHELRCAHGEAAIAEALAALASAGCSPLLVLGASAIADRRDVVPAAVERAGGEVLHFGMPVDPGNLLLLGRLGAAPVIGVPGCARSLKPSGFDWVLERVVAGLPVGRDTIAGMGVGGLLVEVPARPQPRLAPPLAPPERPARVGALVLAAGRSRRMGDNKLVAPLGGKPMVAHAVDALAASRAAPIVVVTGHEAERVRAALAGRPVAFAHNPDHERGLSTSLRAGLASLGDGVDGALVCLGDMPLVSAAHLEALLDAFEAEGGAICVPAFERKRGNPVLWPARHFAEMMALEGDAGARSLLDAHAADVRYVAVADPGVNVDVDTPEALAALRAAGVASGAAPAAEGVPGSIVKLQWLDPAGDRACARPLGSVRLGAAMSRTLDVATSIAATIARLGTGGQVVGTSRRPERPFELYEYEACPFCRKVREALSALDLEAVIYPCPRGGERFRPKARELGGKAQFPYLVDPNAGRSLYESNAIMGYLAETYGQGRLPLASRLGPLTTMSASAASLARVGRGGRARPSRAPERPLELWSYEASPFCRLVRERLCELELPYFLHNVARGSAAREAFVARSGKMQVPYLFDPNEGRSLFESAAIVDHLEHVYAA